MDFYWHKEGHSIFPCKKIIKKNVGDLSWHEGAAGGEADAAEEREGEEGPHLQHP